MVFIVEMEPWEQQASDFAFEAHKGQLDKGGTDYGLHPWRVALKVRDAGGTQDQIVAAYLHDVVEDTEKTLVDLAEAFPMPVVRMVEALTHRKGESKLDYYARIRQTPAAVLVKFCDIYDNLDPERMAKLDGATRNRLHVKYGNALIALADARG